MNNLNGFYLGSDGWGDEIIYKLSDEITKQAIFASPFLESENSDEYIKFAAAYDKKYGKPPQRLATLGYDAVRLITIACSSHGVSRDNIVEQLGRIKDYIGASGKISFGENRENIEMPLYQIQQEQALRLSSDTQSVQTEMTTEP